MTDYLQKLCFYFPTTVLLIDDNTSFLSNLSLKLDKNLTYRLFNKASLALNAINHSFCPDKLSDNCLLSNSNNDENDLTDPNININLSSLHETIYNPQRFSAISVVLVDHYMPELNGLEFCQRLKGNCIKKVIITGEADYDIATQAFNDGIIDKFIVKDSPNFFAKLNSTIKELQMEYFLALSKVLIKNIVTTGSKILIDPVFIDFFNTLSKRNQIAEFYSLDINGSFLLLDFAGRPTWLAVLQETDVNNFYNIAVDNDASPAVIDYLKKKEKIPVFFSEKDKLAPVQQWDRYLHKAELLKTKDNYNYYYASIEGNNIYDFPVKKIISHKEYLLNCMHNETVEHFS